MPRTSTLQVSLLNNLWNMQQKVASGEYASESDVIDEGLMALKEESEERERWEREVLLPAHGRLMASPSSAIPIEQVEQNLEAERRLRRPSKAN